MRVRHFLSAAAILAVASCTVYKSSLLTGGAGGMASTTSAASNTASSASGLGGMSTGTGGQTGSGFTTSSTTAAGTGGSTASSSTSTTTTASTTVSSTATTSASTTSASTTSSTGGGGTVLYISQVKSRGTNGGNDEWIEIYNPGSLSVTFDSTWSVSARSAAVTAAQCATTAYAVRFTGSGQNIPSHGHILFANVAGFSESATTPADGTYTTGVPDAASIVLFHSGTAEDALCFYYDASTQATLACAGSPFTCSGTPVMNPHNNTTGTDTNQSLERKPGGAGGNGINTNNNAADFQTQATADPHDLASAPVP